MRRAPAAAATLAALAALAALAGCPGSEVGTISLGLTTAPGSTVMDRVAQLRLTFTNPRQVLVVDRTERGFDLVLDRDADGEVGGLVIEGLDPAGALVATGMSPPFARTTLNARIVVYMAPPMSIEPAPVALAPARSRPSAAALGYGAVLAGGVDGGSAPSSAIQIYNAYDHSLATGMAMPEARAGVTLAVTANNGVYLFGGTGPGGAATGTLWLFDTTIPPAGRYGVLNDFPQFARTGGLAIPTGGNTYLITGAPPIQLSGSQLAEPAGIAALSSGASVTGADRSVTTVGVDEATGELLRFRGSGPEPLGAQQRGGVAVALPGGRIAVIGGAAAPRDALLVDAATGGLTPVPGALTEAYDALAAAATPRFVIVAGVRPGGGTTQLEVLDAATLERRHAEVIDDEITAAIALPNEQVLLAGAALRLFTPPPPPAPTASP